MFEIENRKVALAITIRVKLTSTKRSQGVSVKQACSSIRSRQIQCHSIPTVSSIRFCQGKFHFQLHRYHMYRQQSVEMAYLAPDNKQNQCHSIPTESSTTIYQGKYHFLLLRYRMCQQLRTRVSTRVTRLV